MSSYNELVKNIENMRKIMRDFYIYGFKTRNDYNEKERRSYDDERRRLESWLSEYMHFERNRYGKNIFISIDSSEISENPLYRAFKAKSFTDKELTLHFMMFDVLSQSNGKKTFNDIKKGIDRIDRKFQEANAFDDSTIRKKLKEYANEGIISVNKTGKETKYFRTEDSIILNADAIKYFSETAPCGVIGSFLLDKMNESQNFFSYKHHYINSALDSQVLYNIFDAISKKSYMVATNFDRALGEEIKIKVVPLKVLSGAQDGRQHLIAYNEDLCTFRTYRLDYLSYVKTGSECKNFQKYRSLLTECEKYMWSVSVSSSAENLAKIEFTVFVDDNEAYIVNRLEREKRGGTVTKIDNNHYKFSFETYKANDLIPWIRTFICRITDLYISDEKTYGRIKNDLNEMYKLYNIGGDEN